MSCHSFRLYILYTSFLIFEAQRVLKMKNACAFEQDSNTVFLSGKGETTLHSYEVTHFSALTKAPHSLSGPGG